MAQEAIISKGDLESSTRRKLIAVFLVNSVGGAALMIFSAPSKEMERERGSWKQGIVYLSLFRRTARETAETKRRSEGENKRILTERRHLLYPLTFLPLRHPVIFLPPGKESALIESAVLHPHPPPLISSLCTPIFHSSSSSFSSTSSCRRNLLDL